MWCCPFIEPPLRILHTAWGTMFGLLGHLLCWYDLKPYKAWIPTAASGNVFSYMNNYSRIKNLLMECFSCHISEGFSLCLPKAGLSQPWAKNFGIPSLRQFVFVGGRQKRQTQYKWLENALNFISEVWQISNIWLLDLCGETSDGQGLPSCVWPSLLPRPFVLAPSCRSWCVCVYGGANWWAVSPSNCCSLEGRGLYNYWGVLVPHPQVNLGG